MYRRIGKITDISIGIEDHGIMICNVDFDFGGTEQTYQVILDDKGEIGRIGTVFGCEFLRRLCLMFGTENINDIIGQVAYALYDSDKHGELIRGIENLPFNKGYSEFRQITTERLFDEINQNKTLI